MVKSVGVIGLGKMGLPMARHLARSGFETYGYDVDRSRADSLTAQGAHAARSPKDLADVCDLVIIAVGFDNEVLDVFAGEDGLLSTKREELVVAVASTVSIETMHRLGELGRTGDRRINVLDIPLCRGEPAAEAGKLLLMAGGDQDVFERCRPAFQAFANDCYLLGDLGSGQVGKMINNLLLWACVSANHEGLKLGEALGVNSEVLRQALLKSSGNNWALETWLQPRPMPWAEKDMAIVMGEADNARLSLPLCGVIREVIKGIKIDKGLPDPRLAK